MSNWSSRAYKAYIKYLYTGELEIEAAEDIPGKHNILVLWVMNWPFDYCRMRCTSINKVNLVCTKLKLLDIIPLLQT